MLFIGESLFIPIFLLYSGMITDPNAFVADSRTAVIAGAVTVVAYVSKFTAACLTARIFRYSTAEFWTVFGLSHARAAVTIPTLVVGLRLGLFDARLFNGAILMILLTSSTSPLLVQRAASKIPVALEQAGKASVFSRILVPILDATASQHLLNIANLLARQHGGKVMAVSVARQTAGRSGSMIIRREALQRVHDVLEDPETDVELIPRVGGSHSEGILQTAMERDATLIVLGWRGRRSLRESVLGTVLDEVVWGSDTPVIIGKVKQPLNATLQVVLLLPRGVVAGSILRRVLDVNLSLAGALNVPLLIRTDPDYSQHVEALLARLDTQVPINTELLVGTIRPEALEQRHAHDVVVLPGFGSRQRFAQTLGNLPERIAAVFDGNLIILHFDK